MVTTHGSNRFTKQEQIVYSTQSPKTTAQDNFTATILPTKTPIENRNQSSSSNITILRHYSIENLQQNQQKISTAKTAKKVNLQQRRLQHRKSTAKSADNFYSKNSKER